MLRRPHSVLTTLALGFTALAFGCERREPPPSPAASSPTIESAEAPQPTSTTPSEQQTPTVQAKMAEHFGSSATMRRALVSGDLRAFRAAAATLSDKELSANLSDTWKPHLEDMRAAARRARDAKTMGTATRALADVGRACGGCHEKLGGPKLTVGAPPAGGSGAKPHMARHAWAAARLWEGLMAPSNESWTKGAEVFTDAPLAPEAVAGPQSVPPEVNELAKRAHQSGTRAHTAKDATARTKAVADVYGTCVGCHTKLSVSLSPTDERL